MGLMGYKRVGSGRGSSSSCSRGFKLNPRRLYVLRLRKRFTFFLTLFDKCKLSYSQAILLLRKVFRRKEGFRTNYSSSRSSTTSSFYAEEQIKGGENNSSYCRVRSYGRSNSSFYAEAIADCLEFIKRTSISMDQIQDPVIHIQD